MEKFCGDYGRKIFAVWEAKVKDFFWISKFSKEGSIQSSLNPNNSYFQKNIRLTSEYQVIIIPLVAHLSLLVIFFHWNLYKIYRRKGPCLDNCAGSSEIVAFFKPSSITRARFPPYINDCPHLKKMFQTISQYSPKGEKEMLLSCFSKIFTVKVKNKTR